MNCLPVSGVKMIDGLCACISNWLQFLVKGGTARGELVVAFCIIGLAAERIMGSIIVLFFTGIGVRGPEISRYFGRWLLLFSKLIGKVFNDSLFLIVE